MWATWGIPRLMAFSAIAAIVAGFYAASQGHSLLLAAFWTVALVLTAICQEMCDSNRRAADARRQHNQGMNRLMQDIKRLDDPFSDDDIIDQLEEWWDLTAKEEEK